MARADMIRTGALITSPVARPEHAQALRDFRDLNRRMLRSYDAAMTNNYNLDFPSTFGSANSEILTSLYLSRGRARTLVKDYAQAKSILRTFQNNVVGHDPFRLKMRVGKYNAQGKFELDQETNRKIEQEWEIAGLPENFSVRKDMSRLEGYRIVEGSAVRDGSILARHWRGYPGNKYGYALDLLESDRLQESYMGRSPETGNVIRFSIERDEWQCPVAYWILTRHPGDVFGYAGAMSSAGREMWRERVEARDIIHFNNLRDRAEQDIGMTELDSIIQHLHRDRQYDIALTYAAIASCCKPFWIKKDFPTGLQYTPEVMEQMMNSVSNGPFGTSGVATGAERNPAQTQQGLGMRTNTVAPATTEVLDYGQSLMQLDPKFPVEAASEFKKDNMRMAAVGAGIAYQNVSGDFQNLGFSASRSSELPARDYYKVRQEHMILNFVRRHFTEWLRYAILSGTLKLDIGRLEEFINAAHFIGRRWPYVNPLQDVQADILSLESGIKSPQQVQDEMEDGQPLDVLYSDIEEASKLQESHGLDFGQEDVTTPTIKKGEPGQETPAVDGAEPGGPADVPEKTGPPQTIKKKKSRGRGMSRRTTDLLIMQGDGRNGTH